VEAFMSDARVLIVDDDDVLLDALKEMLQLRLAHLTVETSASALDALDRIRSVSYDAIVADIAMPGMDGLELLARIGELQPHTPTLLMTAHGDQDLAERALNVGAHDYLQKPLDREHFVSSLRRAIEVRRPGRQLEDEN